jgi:hypothetical protein
MVFQGTIPNRSGHPVIQDWVGVRFLGRGLKVEGVEPFDDLAKRLGLGRRPLPNPGLPLAETLKLQRRQAVVAAERWLRERRIAWIARMEPLLAEQNERLERLRGRQVEELRMALATEGSSLQVRGEKLRQGEARVEKLFASHRRFVEDVMTIEETPYLKLLVVLHRPPGMG